MIAYNLTSEQASVLSGIQFMSGNYFYPIQDVAGNWFITREEVNQCTNEEYMWVKELPATEYIAPEPTEKIIF